MRRRIFRKGRRLRGHDIWEFEQNGLAEYWLLWVWKLVLLAFWMLIPMNLLGAFDHKGCHLWKTEDSVKRILNLRERG